jgi:pimeloyl-ACP methyl ester carboxylesterase
MIIPHFTGDLSERMDKLFEVLSGVSEIHMVGSSFGGLMASLFAMEEPSRIAKIILLAPALNLLEESVIKKQSIHIPTWVYHGTKDAVIDINQVNAIAEELFTNLFFHAVDDDHFLHNTFKRIDWAGFFG